jgi:hypothetical protein
MTLYFSLSPLSIGVSLMADMDHKTVWRALEWPQCDLNWFLREAWGGSGAHDCLAQINWIDLRGKGDRSESAIFPRRCTSNMPDFIGYSSKIVLIRSYRF